MVTKVGIKIKNGKIEIVNGEREIVIGKRGRKIGTCLPTNIKSQKILMVAFLRIFIRVSSTKLRGWTIFWKK